MFAAENSNEDGSIRYVTPEIYQKFTSGEIMIGEKMLETIDMSREIQGVRERVQQYQERMRTADRVILIFGCDDGRVNVSVNTQVIDGMNTLLLYVPKIGGGTPSPELFTGLVQAIEAVGVDHSKLSVLTTQHGSTEEIGHVLAGHPEAAAECISCGLRGVFNKNQEALNQIGEVLRDLPTSTAYSELPEDIRQQLARMSEASGIPVRLLRRAAERNFSGDLEGNSLAIFEHLASYDLFPDIEINRGYYDHNLKKIHIMSENRTVSSAIQVEIPEWPHSHQDPEGLVLTFGAKSTSLHHGVILPESVGSGESNDFSAVAINTDENLLDALSEAWYAASHRAAHAEGNGHGENFATTSFCSIICDDESFVRKAKEVIEGSNFRGELLPAFKHFGKIYLLNIETESVTEVNLV